jgi:hypothetical protein
VEDERRRGLGLGVGLFFFFFVSFFCRVVSLPSSFRVRLFPSSLFFPHRLPSFLQLQLLPSSRCFPSELLFSSLPAFVYLPCSLPFIPSSVLRILSSFLPAFVFLPSSLYSGFRPLNHFSSFIPPASVLIPSLPPSPLQMLSSLRMVSSPHLFVPRFLSRLRFVPYYFSLAR